MQQVAQKLRYYPLVARSALGCKITDVDGKEYLDLTAGWCVANTGYGHPAVARTIDDTYRELSFVGAASLVHPSTVELAERLVASALGAGPTKVLFGNSGSDANDGISKLVPLARKRPRMISFFGGMHVMVAGTAGLSGIPFTTRLGH